MSTSIEDISTQLQTNTKYQRTPTTLVSSDYLALAIVGTKAFYIAIGDNDLWTTEFDGTSTISRTLDILDFDYCVLASEIAFYEQILCDWNTLVGYTTNAITVTNANKPFENISNIIKKKEKELITLFYRMTERTSMSDIDAVDVEQVDFTYS